MTQKQNDESHDYVVAYHGTNSSADFSSFSITEDLGFHFGTVDAANKRLLDISIDDPDALEHMRIIPCILRIQNSLRLRDCYTWDSQDVIGGLLDAGVIDLKEYGDLSDGGYLDQEMMRDILYRNGYDSVVYENQTELGGDSYMVLDPELIDFKLSPSAKRRPRAKLG
jgi:hypothetical protein